SSNRTLVQMRQRSQTRHSHRSQTHPCQNQKKSLRHPLQVPAVTTPGTGMRTESICPGRYGNNQKCLRVPHPLRALWAKGRLLRSNAKNPALLLSELQELLGARGAADASPARERWIKPAIIPSAARATQFSRTRPLLRIPLFPLPGFSFRGSELPAPKLRVRQVRASAPQDSVLRLAQHAHKLNSRRLSCPCSS